MSGEAPSTVAVARVVVAAARETPGVASLSHGVAGEIATYGENTRVPGVRVRTKPPRRVMVHVVARYGRPLDELGDDVRRRAEEALADQFPGSASIPVDVHIADVRVEEAALTEESGGSAGPGGTGTTG